jgi:thiol:disulfide interchange protein DsbC
MRLIAFLALSFLPFTVLGDTADDVRARLLERYPSTPVDTVRTTPITGLFEVAMGRKIVYVDATGQYFLFGRIFDLPGNRDLTEDRLRDLSRLDVSLIQPDQILEQGEGSQVVYVFSDPACGHCQKLEQTLAAMSTLRVRTILLPLQPGSSDLARDIWCAPDRQRAWSAWMLKGTRPDPAPEACQAERPGAEPGLGQALRHPGHTGAGLAGRARLPGRHGGARAFRLAESPIKPPSPPLPPRSAHELPPSHSVPAVAHLGGLRRQPIRPGWFEKTLLPGRRGRDLQAHVPGLRGVRQTGPGR